MVYFEVLTIIVFNSISTIACMWLFLQFFCLPKKTLAVKMIFILCLSDFIFHLTNILTLWTFPAFVLEIILLLLNTSVIFSVSWAACIAFMVYKMLTMETINPVRFYKVSLLLTVFLALAIVIGYIILCFSSLNLSRNEFLAETENLTLVLILTLFPVLPLCLTTFYYLKTISILKKLPNQNDTGQIIQVLYRYAFVQIVAIGPTFVTILINTFLDLSSEDDDNAFSFIQMIVNALLGLTGFGNSLVFFYQRKTSDIDIENMEMPTSATNIYEVTDMEFAQSNKSFDSYYQLTAALM